jgi:hypothetical protein
MELALVCGPEWVPGWFFLRIEGFSEFVGCRLAMPNPYK